MYADIFRPSFAVVSPANESHPILIPPAQSHSFTFTFTPFIMGPMNGYFAVRNNLTLFELIEVSGTGGRGVLVLPPV
jgi:hypothetical protein